MDKTIFYHYYNYNLYYVQIQTLLCTVYVIGHNVYTVVVGGKGVAFFFFLNKVARKKIDNISLYCTQSSKFLMIQVSKHNYY